MTEVKLTVRDHAIGAALALAYVVVLCVTANDLAMSRDESFYVIAAEHHAGWFRLAASDFEAATQRDAVDRFWLYNHEHPALIKNLFALSFLAHEEWSLFDADSTAFRFPAIVLSGLLLWLIYAFGARAMNRTVGLFAALAFAALPRPFYHAHLNAFDVPITVMVAWTTYAYWRSLSRPRWAVMTGIAFGCALATKHNAWIVPGVFAIHWAWMAVRERRARRSGAPPSVSLVPWWLLSMAVLGPAIFLGSWPWLWHDTVPRIEEYARFHLQHEYYNMAYFGRNYYRPPFPVSYPFVMTLYTVPLTTVALALTGLVLRAGAIVPWRFKGRTLPEGATVADAKLSDVLFFGSLMAPLFVIALPSTPIFGGTKHWFTAYPFMCLFSGVAFDRVARAVCEIRRWPVLVERGAPFVAGAVLLAPSVYETAHSHRFALSHYAYAAGGVPGAADDGMNRQFWGFTTGNLVPFFVRNLPDGGSVFLCDTTWPAWNMLQRDGLIPRNIRPASGMASADYVLVHHEDHFAEVDFQAWMTFGSVRPAHVLTYDGVPIISVYENPRRRARARSPRP